MPLGEVMPGPLNKFILSAAGDPLTARTIEHSLRSPVKRLDPVTPRIRAELIVPVQASRVGLGCSVRVVTT
jgi:hypothetical protein